MPEITRRRTGEMLRKLFEVLLSVPEGMQARDALAETEKRLTLSEYEKGEYASGGQRFEEPVPGSRTSSTHFRRRASWPESKAWSGMIFERRLERGSVKRVLMPSPSRS
jgi:hypothetical protein